jgi:hypothetical protein
MNTFDQFKNLIPNDSEKFVLMENGEPACACSRADRPRYVVMPWREFEMMRGGNTRARICFAEVADEILDVPMFAPVRGGFAPLAVETEKIRLEDLPI